MSAAAPRDVAAASRVPRWMGAAVGVFGASAVLLGAFGAHGLHGVLNPNALRIWHTAVEYQFWHVPALGLGVIFSRRSRAARIAATLFAIGIGLFCGSLYALALNSPRWIGIVTPFGGAALIAGWIALGIGCASRPAKDGRCS